MSEWFHRFVNSCRGAVAARQKQNRQRRDQKWRQFVEEEYGHLILTDDGFRLLKKGKTEFTLRWDDVRTITTFKRDFWCYDMICLAFEIGDDEWVEAWESMIDFWDVRERMMELFPKVPKSWYQDVMLPAYAPCQKDLWRRSI